MWKCGKLAFPPSRISQGSTRVLGGDGTQTHASKRTTFHHQGTPMTDVDETFNIK